MFFHMVYKSGQIFLPFCHNPRVWKTDRQTDGRTDGQTEFSSLDRVCIPCSAVKMGSCWHGAPRRHGWGRGLGGKGVTLKAAPSEALKAPSQDAPTDCGDRENVMSSPSGDRGGAENRFSAFRASQNASRRDVCRKLASCQKTFINGDER